MPIPAAIAITGSSGSGVRGPPRRMRSRRTSGSKGTSSTPAAVGVDARSTPGAKRKLGTALISSGETLSGWWRGTDGAGPADEVVAGGVAHERLPRGSRREGCEVGRSSPVGGELLRNPQARRARPRVGRQFGRIRPDHL